MDGLEKSKCERVIVCVSVWFEDTGCRRRIVLKEDLVGRVAYLLLRAGELLWARSRGLEGSYLPVVDRRRGRASGSDEEAIVKKSLFAFWGEISNDLNFDNSMGIFKGRE